MWNVRNVLRNLSYRLKTSANGCTHGTKEGRELEDEYKHLWASGFRAGDWHARPSAHYPHLAGPLSSCGGQQNGAGRSQERRSQRESDWDSLKFPLTGRWIEALGWGAALGFGLNLLHVRQEEAWRRRCPLERLTALEGRLPAWTRDLYAFSMPLHARSPLIKSVLPLPAPRSFDTLDGSSDESFSDADTSVYSLTESSEDADNKQIRYTPESVALMRVMREQLTNVARDYVSELQALLGRAQGAAASEDSAQEEYNLGLFYELGIGVPRNPEKAVDHYMEAAALNHPVAVENVMFLHKFATASAQLGVRRASSSPALTALTDSQSDLDSDSEDETGPPRAGKFWRSDTDSGGSFDASSRSRSRSNSLPMDGGKPWLLGGAGAPPVRAVV